MQFITRGSPYEHYLSPEGYEYHLSPEGYEYYLSPDGSCDSTTIERKPSRVYGPWRKKKGRSSKVRRRLFFSSYKNILKAYIMAGVKELIPGAIREQASQARTEDLQSRLNETQALSNYLNMVLAQRTTNQNLSPILHTIKANLDQERETLQEQINNTKLIISAQEQEIGVKESEIRSREQVLREKDDMVINQKGLLNVRDRMLQLSQEKNIYKQKVIYTLISLIIGVFLVMIVGYVYFGGSSKQ